MTDSNRPMARIIICTPVDGSLTAARVTYGYHQSVRQLERLGAVLLPSELCFNDDLVRARSRAVRFALEQEGWDWLLWWDEDVVPQDVSIVGKMIAIAEERGLSMIGAPYPRKRIPTSFPYRPLRSDLERGTLSIKDGCLEVDAIGFGFTLTKRSMLDEMCAFFSRVDGYIDDNGSETVGLFIQRFYYMDGIANNRRMLMSEDYSFCDRARAMNFSVNMYAGLGSPCAHIGEMAYTGSIDDVGNIL